jgi:hypothetical protein
MEGAVEVINGSDVGPRPVCSSTWAMRISNVVNDGSLMIYVDEHRGNDDHE